MDKKLKTKWLRALRSGEIEQGKGGLLDEDGRMCCIGVLGRVCGLTDKQLLAERTQLTGGALRPLEFLGETAWLLAAMNDGSYYNGKKKRPRSFKQIADWIEKRL